MSLVFRNALMPSENQQALRLRLAYLMHRFLLIALGMGFLLPTAANAEVNQKIHKMCLQAKDYLGCVKAQATKSSDIPSLRVIQGKTELTGNSCPNGHAYSGAGYCTQVICVDRFKKHPDFIGKGWSCKGSGLIAGKTVWGYGLNK